MKLFRGLSGKVSGGDIHMLVCRVVASVGLQCVCSSGEVDRQCV